jgi:CDK inhibitor PHO81
VCVCLADAVFFASYCGLSRSTAEGQLSPANRIEDDRRCTSIREAVKFARANNLLGVMLEATILVREFSRVLPGLRPSCPDNI